MTIDWSILINWIISGLIGLIFGIAGAWATHRLDRKRDDITWEREKQKLEDNWQHEKELLEIQFKQKLAEIESQRLYEEKKKIREELLKGLDIVSIRSK